MPGFLEVVSTFWNLPVRANSAAGRVVARLKAVRRGLKQWSKRTPRLNVWIANSELVIDELDHLEELRPLVRREWNIRTLLKAHVENLRGLKRIIWQQRCSLRWVKLGDESTKFFHAWATKALRRRAIPVLRGPDGLNLESHLDKAHALWTVFRDRLGQAETRVLPRYLADLIHRHDGLEVLSAPFSVAEIDAVVKDLPSDRSPGPDGFNGLFFKTCWPIIKEEIYALCHEFYYHNASLRCLNASFITLIPKVLCPESVNDFRPISLLNSCLKLITKLLSIRLQRVILNLVHANQYGFLKCRSIQDCLAWTLEYLHQCKHSRCEIVVIKLDFEKAFDLIEHSAIRAILQNMGFDDRWMGWIDNLLDSGSSAVVLNGVPGKQFSCLRGVRQGDPLSPLLFVLATDLLQVIINRAFHLNLLGLPIPNGDVDFPIVQYADDTLIIMQASSMQLVCLKALLESFAQATGLHVNFAKSCLLPINISDHRAKVLAGTLGCSIGTFPFTYLGIPVDLSRPKIRDLMPVIDRIDRRLASCASFLSFGGRLQVVKSVFSALPAFALSVLKVQEGFIQAIDKRRRIAL